jgi:hypothetical protein
LPKTPRGRGRPKVINCAYLRVAPCFNCRARRGGVCENSGGVAAAGASDAPTTTTQGGQGAEGGGGGHPTRERRPPTPLYTPSALRDNVGERQDRDLDAALASLVDDPPSLVDCLLSRRWVPPWVEHLVAPAPFRLLPRCPVHHAAARGARGLSARPPQVGASRSRRAALVGAAAAAAAHSRPTRCRPPQRERRWWPK